MVQCVALLWCPSLVRVKGFRKWFKYCSPFLQHDANTAQRCLPEDGTFWFQINS